MMIYSTLAFLLLLSQSTAFNLQSQQQQLATTLMRSTKAVAAAADAAAAVLAVATASSAVHAAPAVVNAAPSSFLRSSFNTAAVADAAASTPVYFGVGCFWHVQHEFVQAEKNILGRSNDQLTSVAGYAGSTRVGKDDNDPSNRNGLVCYHNLLGKGDYGKLGYGEAVQVQLPADDRKAFRAFADAYFALFGADNERPDKGDRGPEYRSLVGVPGGVQGPYYAELQAAAEAKGLRLAAGKGSGDADTLGKKMVWVMDSREFPFRQAEVYHQFHDGFFPGEQYPQSYNSLVEGALQRGLISRTGCPDI